MYNMCGHYFILTVECCDVRMMYWALHVDHTIQTATMDGTRHKVFVNNASDTNSGEIYEITSDAKGIVWLPDLQCISFKLKLSCHIIVLVQSTSKLYQLIAQEWEQVM